MRRIDVQAKRQVRNDKRRQRALRALRRALYRRCFWTRPLGHAWTWSDQHSYSKLCVGCGKETYVD